jgi:ribosome-associated protein
VREGITEENELPHVTATARAVELAGMRAIVEEIEERLRRAGVRPARREGEREGRWVLLDYLDLVIHVQHAEERTYYALERLWKDCPRLPLPEPVGVGGARGDGGPGGAGRR